MKADEDCKDGRGNDKRVSGWNQIDSAGVAFQSSQLWDTTFASNSNVKLEYMDFDDFLNENNIEDEMFFRQNLSASIRPNGHLSHDNTSSSTHPPNNLDVPADLNRLADTLASSSPNRSEFPTTHMNPASRDARLTNKFADVLEVHENEASCHSMDASSPMSSASRSTTTDSTSPNFQSNAKVYSEGKLKSQILVKKSRKQYVPSEMKDDRYWARRRKNNVAAKRSRDARRVKENQIALKAKFLQNENDSLREELDKMNQVLENVKMRLAVYES